MSDLACLFLLNIWTWIFGSNQIERIQISHRQPEYWEIDILFRVRHSSTLHSWWIVTCNWTYSWWYLAISHTEEIKDNEWHNIHCSYSSNRQALYVDWLKINENYKPSPPIYYLWNHFWIWKDANWSWGYYFWSIDEVRMYKRPLTDSEINNLYKIAK